MMPIEYRWIYKETDMDVYIHNSINLSKDVYDKVQKIDYDKIGYLVVMLFLKGKWWGRPLQRVFKNK
jgi:high-affinity nickel permease